MKIYPQPTWGTKCTLEKCLTKKKLKQNKQKPKINKYQTKRNGRKNPWICKKAPLQKSYSSECTALQKNDNFNGNYNFYTAFVVNVRVNERERICILFRINFMVMAKFCNNLRVTLYRFSHRNEMIFYTKGTFLPNGNFHTLHTIHIPRPCNGTLNLGVRFDIVYLRILYLIVNSFFCFVHHFYIKLKTLIYDCNLFNNAKTEKQSRMTFGRQCNKKIYNSSSSKPKKHFIGFS